MPNSIDYSADWQKVLLGLHSAQIPYEGVRFLTDSFNDMTSEAAREILTGGHFGDSSNEHREARNLFRALNFLLRASESTVDPVLKESFRYGGALLPDLAAKVREAYKKIAPRPAPHSPPTPISTTVTAAPSHAAAQSTPATQVFTSERIPNPHHAALLQTRAHFKNNAAAQGAWDRARQDIWNGVSEKREWLQFNFNSLQHAINLAFQNFNRTLAADSKDTRDRQVLVASLLGGALKHAPPPLSVVGKAIDFAFGQREPDNYSPSTKYRALTGPDTPFFVRHMAKMMEEYERNRTAINLSNIVKQTSFASIGSDAAAAILAVMQQTTKSALDDAFGDLKSSRDHLERMYDRYLAREAAAAVINTHLGARAEQLNLDNHERTFIGSFLQKLINDTEKQISKSFSVCCKLVHMDDLRIAIEMLLYSQYVIDIFDKQPDKLRPAGDEMVNFFAQQGPWGVIMLNTDDHAASTAKHRLNWKGGDNHKKMLVMFCRWYVVNVNPFHLITGAPCNGAPYSAALIQQMCKDHIDLINAAVKQGRKVNWAGWSSWDWATIYSAYDQARYPRWDDD